MSGSQYKSSRISTDTTVDQASSRILRLMSQNKEYLGPFQDLSILSKREFLKSSSCSPNYKMDDAS